MNGRKSVVDCDFSKTIIDIIRDDLGLKGTKKGCEIGECGACTVIMNGEAVCSCLILAGQLEGATIETVESLEENGIHNERLLTIEAEGREALEQARRALAGQTYDRFMAAATRFLACVKASSAAFFCACASVSFGSSSASPAGIPPRIRP